MDKKTVFIIAVLCVVIGVLAYVGYKKDNTDLSTQIINLQEQQQALIDDVQPRLADISKDIQNKLKRLNLIDHAKAEALRLNYFPQMKPFVDPSKDYTSKTNLPPSVRTTTK
jgi:predicted PurR-regulated permease PerM